MFGRKRPRPTTVHYDRTQDFFVAEDGTLYPDPPFATGSEVEMEVRYVMAWLFRQFADLLSARDGNQRSPQSDQIIDVAFESNLQSGSM